MTAVLASVLLAASAGQAPADVFTKDHLVAWCIVPFDAKQRGPAERVAMLQRLGFRRFAYDWRAEHLPTFEAELAALKRAGITLQAVWFPASLERDARHILGVLRKHGVKTQLWVTMHGGGPAANPEDQRRRVESHAAAVR